MTGILKLFYCDEEDSLEVAKGKTDKSHDMYSSTTSQMSNGRSDIHLLDYYSCFEHAFGSTINKGPLVAFPLIIILKH